MDDPLRLEPDAELLPDMVDLLGHELALDMVLVDQQALPQAAERFE